ncbi:exopolysaccharide biosynthesis polyprenyl glycosylphosphotransferase [Acinetobacter boissieri]|uniref:Putative colanic acid biosysnthesis UDP-glucose lipid carrier transferase n=1 Tax=Acinetobacter boissieri TaxID=1219383 RepID=A0A1G6HII5_9GAMM|nr:exopolysaccharide biosynthesis polyprenyl glycosylphosphotransferase [Acinetobacter boissieri]SDB94137.1 putative colanic acid biosysnthesis UDP-glucose lipid carrier transferase [Acinetobacter boissieri]
MIEPKHSVQHVTPMQNQNTILSTPFIGFNKFIKRLEDIIVSFIILILISPLLLIISILVKTTSHGPILFKQNRHGLNGTIIKVWKFRSMSVMEEGDSVKQATKNDQRVTRVGAFLRKTSLDELPQFFNVLFGSMSIVGPRPHALSHNEYYAEHINDYMLRHIVKPGITGLAQVSGWRGETDTLDKMQNRVTCDLEYIAHWSLWLDIKLIFLTILRGFTQKTAY